MTAVIPSQAAMISARGSSQCSMISPSWNQSCDVYPWVTTSGKTTRSEAWLFAFSIAEIIFRVLPTISPLVVFICAIVTLTREFYRTLGRFDLVARGLLDHGQTISPVVI